MKSLTLKNAFKMTMLAIATLMLANCAKSNSSNKNVAAGVGYTTTTNICYQNNGTVVDNSNCLNNPNNVHYYCRSNTGATVLNSNCHRTTSTGNVNGAYTLQNGRCYANNGGYLQEVAYQYCTQQAGGAIYQSCRSGSFYYNGMPVVCGLQGEPGVTHICPAGTTLQNASGQQVICQ